MLSRKRKHPDSNAIVSLALLDQPDPGRIKLRSYASLDLGEVLTLSSIRSEASRLIVSSYEECPAVHMENLKKKSALPSYTKPIGDEKTPENLKEEARVILTRIYKSFTKVKDITIETKPKQLSVVFSVPVIWKADLNAFGDLGNVSGSVTPVGDMLIVEIKLPSDNDHFTSIPNVDA